MKIIFVYPRFEKFLQNNQDLDKRLIDYFLGNFTTPPSLGIPILASLTPPAHEVELVDDNNGDPVDFSIDADLIAINCFTPQAMRAFELGDGYRAQGKKVIMGGFFPSFMVEECLKHADSVNVGEGEPTWPQILEDASRGTLKRIYKGGASYDLSKMKIPRRDLFYKKQSYDWDEDLVQLTRGCMYSCAMCAIPAHMGSRIRFRPIESVVEEISQLKYENVYLADDTLFFPQKRIAEYVKALLEALVPLNKKYFVSSTMALNIDDAFLDLCARAGVKNFYCTMNVDPVSIKALSGGEAEQRLLCDLVKKLEDRDIHFFGSCALGRDWDDTSIADRVLALFDRAGIYTSEFFIFTPYPGSVHWDRLIRQNRIIDFNWSHYNGAHVVSTPGNMTVDQLYGQFIKVWNEFFRARKELHGASLEPATWKEGRRSVGKPLERQGVRGQAVITGIGVLSPIGNSPREITESLRESRSGIAPVTRFDVSSFRTNLGGQIRNFSAGECLDAKELADYEDLYLQYAITAARKAAADANVVLSSASPRNDIALVLGTCNGGLLSAEEEYRWIHGKGSRPFDEKMNLTAQYYGFGKALAAALNVSGEVWVVTTACSSTTGAIGLAQLLINNGYYSTVIVGGSDTLCIANMSGFNGLKAVSSQLIAPFSVPSGLNIGEASCFWVVEELEQALLRHARCYGKLAGHATSCDAYHPTSPDPRGEGVYRTLKAALDDAGIRVSDLGCVNAHGTGTEANDRAETKGIQKFIGNESIPVTSTKSFFGHCMGTTGILEATCNLLAMNSGFVPPTLNFTEARPGCTLDYVPNVAREKEYRGFVTANYAFGGNNAASVITTWDRALPRRRAETARVVITGAGAITSLGITLAQTLEGLRNNRIGLLSIERLKLPGLKSNLAGLVRDFKPSEIDRRIDFTGMNLISKLAVAAAHGALQRANLRLKPKDCEQAGVVMGVCNGPPESDHMNSVFSTDGHLPDINNFSNIVANSTTGWVANALNLKGVNMTLSPGPHAGCQAVAYAFNMLRESRGQSILAVASDEIYPQSYFNYDLIGFLYQGEQERNFRLYEDEPKRKVIGEGAGALLLETLEASRSRGAAPIAEILGYGMSMDAAPYGEQAMNHAGLTSAVRCALSRSEISGADIDLVIWAPQGNNQDTKLLRTVEEIAGSRSSQIPLVTTTFNTGYIESASILVTTGAVLESLRSGVALWPQRTGIPAIDNRTLSAPPGHILVAASTDLGYNFAVILAAGGAIA